MAFLHENQTELYFYSFFLTDSVTGPEHKCDRAQLDEKGEISIFTHIFKDM